MLYRQSMANSALWIPIPSTRIRFPKRHVIVHPRNHIQSNICTNGINIIFIQKSPWKDFYIHHSIYCTERLSIIIMIKPIGVNIPSTLVIFSKSRKLTTITSTAHNNPPAQKGRPNCWLRFEPAPAIITKPTTKQEMIKAISKILFVMGPAICERNSKWSLDRK